MIGSGDGGRGIAERGQGNPRPTWHFARERACRCPRLRSRVAGETASAAAPPLMDYSSAWPRAPPSPLTLDHGPPSFPGPRDSGAPSSLYPSELLLSNPPSLTHPLVIHPLRSPSPEEETGLGRQATA